MFSISVADIEFGQRKATIDLMRLNNTTTNFVCFLLGFWGLVNHEKFSIRFMRLFYFLFPTLTWK